MSAQYIPTNPNLPNAGRLHQALRALREGAAILGQEVNSIVAMRNGDNSDVTHYAQVVTYYGVGAGQYADANTAAKRLDDETEAVKGNMDNVMASLNQLCGFLGI